MGKKLCGFLLQEKQNAVNAGQVGLWIGPTMYKKQLFSLVSRGTSISRDNLSVKIIDKNMKVPKYLRLKESREVVSSSVYSGSKTTELNNQGYRVDQGEVEKELSKIFSGKSGLTIIGSFIRDELDLNFNS